MKYYITPSYYPDFQINYSIFDRKQIELQEGLNYSFYRSYTDQTNKSWIIINENDYLNLFISEDKVSIEFESSSNIWLSKFAIFIWSNYPVIYDIHIINEDMNKNYLFHQKTSLKELLLFFNG